jgi:peptide/nickel transport system permease protein
MAVPTLFIVAVSVFVLIRLIPGDPAALMLGDLADPASLADLRRRLGLDQSLPVQFGIWLGNVFAGDLGQSITSSQAVLPLVLERFWISAKIVLAAVLFASLVAVPAGMIAAWRQNSVTDFVLVGASTLLLSIPTFWLGLLLIGFFSVRLDWLPTSGFDGPEYVVLPALTLAAFSLATIARTTRSCMLDVLGHEYVRTARAKGLGELAVTAKHALKNAVVPLVAVVGLQFGYLLGSSVVTESVFTWPGLGLLLVDAIKHRDLPVIQGAVLLISASFALINLIVDMLYAALDPRIRLS